jgi:hypothetical protein
MSLKNDICDQLCINSNSIEELTSVNKELSSIFERVITLISIWRLNYSDLSDIRKADALFAFAFGQGRKGTPGETNAALAWVMRELHRDTLLPVFAQREIAEALEVLGIRVTHRTVQANDYVDTKSAVDQLSQHGAAVAGKKIVVVAHPDHQFRCGELLRRYNAQPVFPKIADCLPKRGWAAFGCDRYGYSRRSTQKWTTKRTLYIRHEIYARISSYYRGDI